MKKVIIVGMLLVMALTLVACGGKGSESKSKDVIGAGNWEELSKEEQTIKLNEEFNLAQNLDVSIQSAMASDENVYRECENVGTFEVIVTKDGCTINPETGLEKFTEKFLEYSGYFDPKKIKTVVENHMIKLTVTNNGRVSYTLVNSDTGEEIKFND